MTAPTETEEVVRKAAHVLAEVMGQQTGELFFSLYHKEEDRAVILYAAKSLLEGLIGAGMAEQKLNEIITK